QYGMVVSGPIWKNKTFWAFNFESRRERVGTVQTASFPIDEFRSGNFSKLLTGTVNPATGRLFRQPIVIYDPMTGQPFPGNIIPTTRINAGARNVLDKYVPRASFVQADPLDFTARSSVDQPIDTNT